MSAEHGDLHRYEKLRPVGPVIVEADPVVKQPSPTPDTLTPKLDFSAFTSSLHEHQTQQHESLPPIQPASEPRTAFQPPLTPTFRFLDHLFYIETSHHKTKPGINQTSARPGFNAPRARTIFDIFRRVTYDQQPVIIQGKPIPPREPTVFRNKVNIEGKPVNTHTREIKLFESTRAKLDRYDDRARRIIESARIKRVPTDTRAQRIIESARINHNAPPTAHEIWLRKLFESMRVSRVRFNDERSRRIIESTRATRDRIEDPRSRRIIESTRIKRVPASGVIFNASEAA